jgi:RNA polymerase sigma factor (sigma-70 family)
VIWSRAANRPRTEETQPTFSLERELLARVGAKDVEAFEKLYRIYQPRLARFLGTVLQRSQLVEEVLDDTMMTVWQGAANFRGASKPSTWIFAIAYRKALKAKARWPDPVQDDAFDVRVDPGARPDEQLQQQRLHRALLQAMQQLSVEHRAVIDLTYFHGLGYREIADIVACPAETVKTRVFHARQRLRRAMSGTFTDWLWNNENA